VALLKNEAVAGEELARVLCQTSNAMRTTQSSMALWDAGDDNSGNDTSAPPALSSAAKSAIELGRSFGLPVSDDSSKIVFKVTPIQPPSYQQRNLIRDDDHAVLGKEVAAELTISSDGIALPPIDWMERILF
jgi:hypothetical protein